MDTFRADISKGKYNTLEYLVTRIGHMPITSLSINNLNHGDAEREIF